VDISVDKAMVSPTVCSRLRVWKCSYSLCT